MGKLRNLSSNEIEQLMSQGCSAENWNSIKVSEKFGTNNIRNCRFKGEIVLGANVTINNVGAYMANCMVEDGAYIENVAQIECQGVSRFGGGTRVKTVNEGGGREVTIFDGLTAQTAYIMAMYKHRPATLARMEEMIEHELQAGQSTMCRIGKGAKITNSGILRNVRIGEGAEVEGATILDNGTVVSSEESPAFVGADVKMYNFIMLDGAKVTDGATLKSCFVGQNVKICALSGADTLFFANSHFENGETCSVFAGPYSVSHHKSSLLIAGMFSFFNAGSATNMSNHLFKTGPVHQGIHQRGCKFASGAYIMQPCKVGAFTVVLGHHKSHPDTEYLPFSYLIENGGTTVLLPAHNLTTYGTVRDMAKWPQRDGRKGEKRDMVNFEEANPFICERVAGGEKILSELVTKSGDAATITHKRMTIKTTMAKRGAKMYGEAKNFYMGKMLESPAEPSCEGGGHWIDAGGQYMPLTTMNAILNDVDNGTIHTTKEIDERLFAAFGNYTNMAKRWAIDQLTEKLGHTPTQQEIENAIAYGQECGEKLRKAAEADKGSDFDEKSMIGYGIDAVSHDDIAADFEQVRKEQGVIK